MSKGKLYLVSGPSGAGKSTILKIVLRKFKDIIFSVSATTRPKRKSEKEGMDYFFIGIGKFKDMIKKNKFLEWAKVHGAYYGTPIKFVEDTLKSGKDCILDIDVQGAARVMRKYPVVSIFIVPESLKILEERLKKRKTESQEAIKKRLAIAEEEIKKLKYYKYLVVNDSLKFAVSRVKAIITAERCKIK